MMCTVSPLIVAGLFGNASMLDPFLNTSFVVVGLSSNTSKPFATTWRANEAIFAMFFRDCLRLGARTTALILGRVSALYSRLAAMVWDLPLCRDQRATMNWAESNNSFSW